MSVQSVETRERTGDIYRQILAYCTRRWHYADGISAEDIAQDVLLALAQANGPVTGTQLGYAFGIASHKIVDARRAVRRALDTVAALRATADARTVSPSAEEDAGERLDVDDLMEITRALPRRQRQVVLLSTVWDLDRREVGRLLAIGPSAVGRLLARARQSLQHHVRTGDGRG